MADCLRQVFNYIDKEQLKKIEKDLRLNHCFIDFDYKRSAEDSLRVYSHFFNEISRKFRICYCPIRRYTKFH